MRDKLDSIFYRVYRFQVSVGNQAIAVFFSMLFISFLLTVNTVSVLNFLYAFKGIRYVDGNSVQLGLGTLGTLMFLNYCLFVYKGRYKKIIKRIRNEDGMEVVKGNLAVVLYAVSTIIILGLSFYMMILRNKGEL